MPLLRYRWWVPRVSRRPGSPLRRFFTDIEHVAPWAYLVLPAFLALCALLTPGLRSGPALLTLLCVSLCWVSATRARFRMATAINASRDRRRLRLVRPTHRKRPRLAA